MQRREMLTMTGAAAIAAPGLVRAADGPYKIRDLYTKGGEMSEMATANEGRRITMEGFMAPPLKANSTFFVQTKKPMAVCPFCETETEWPDNILAVYTQRIYDVVPFNLKITTTGTLELGKYRDPETGFLSMVRLADATYSIA